ncbi:MAG: hypothetical protein BGP01_04390 [Paludibacter sp. 47-17]|nr:MAG: hypothetical protein BGP01_04390 [Paludibacter sp. 47-17]
MNILIANHHLKRTGGTENYSFALAEEMVRLGHQVEYFTYTKGYVSKKLEESGIRFKSRKTYDLILANHKTTIQFLHRKGFTVQTCHGTLPTLEQPSKFADAYVSVTQEVHEHLQTKGIDSTLIKNGINCRRFAPRQQLNDRLGCVLSLCQSDEANAMIHQVCSRNGIRYLSADKKLDNVWHLEDLINQADLVVGIGRSLYDAMACGRTVISFDKRRYSEALGDGYLDAATVVDSIRYNCSGRGSRRKMDEATFENELRKYRPSDGPALRAYALQELNIEHAAQQYLALAHQTRTVKEKPATTIVSPLLYYRARRNQLSSFSPRALLNWLCRGTG